MDRGKKIVQVQLELRDLPFLPLDHVWILHIEPGSCIGAGFAADLVPGGRKGCRGDGVVGLRGGWPGGGRPKTGVVAGCGDTGAGIAVATLGMRLGVKAQASRGAGWRC